MILKTLEPHEQLQQKERTQVLYVQVNTVLNEVAKQPLTDKMIAILNHEIDNINSAVGSEKQYSKQLKKSQTKILINLERKMKLVTKNHYRNTWLPVGMTALGLPIGTAFAMAIHNMAFVGVGLPIGLFLGMALGTKMDKKAAAEGRQIDLTIRY
ncbi:hypothetical protein GC194_02645 [bacterium]|nr:hypothetical protein [bacterium]